MKGNAYDRYISTSVTNENVLKMLNTGAGIFAWSKNYSLWLFWGQDGSSEQCDKKAWQISRAGGIYYAKKVFPNSTIEEAAKSIGLTLSNTGD